MDSSPPSAADLLAKWSSQHQESAFHALVARYAGLARNAAKRNCNDETLTAEAPNSPSFSSPARQNP